MSANKYYYVYKRFDYNGNDAKFLEDVLADKYTCNMDKALMFNEADSKTLIERMDGQFPMFNRILVQKAQALACYHAPASKFTKPKKDIPIGTPCLILSKRDQTGKNASFWYFGSSGYGCDYRAAEIFSYGDKTFRDFEFFVPLKDVMKASERRLDIQDDNDNDPNPRQNHHSVCWTLKTIYKDEKNV